MDKESLGIVMPSNIEILDKHSIPYKQLKIGKIYRIVFVTLHRDEPWFVQQDFPCMILDIKKDNYSERTCISVLDEQSNKQKIYISPSDYLFKNYFLNLDNEIAIEAADGMWAEKINYVEQKLQKLY